MLWPRNNNTVALRKQSLLRQDKSLSFYSVEDLREKLPVSAFVNPYATRLVSFLPRKFKVFQSDLQISKIIIALFL